MKTLIMEKTDKVELIKGTFSAKEAKEILMEMLRSKINFHQLKNWSAEERTGKSHMFSKQRLEELRASRTQLEAYLSEAEALNKRVTINTTINLALEDTV